MALKQQTMKDLITISGRLHYILNNKNSTDPEDIIEPKEMETQIIEDLEGRVKEIKIHPNWVSGTVVGGDVTYISGKEIKLRLITQNPNKKDPKDNRKKTAWAKMASAGDQITWIYRDGNALACVHNGVFKLSNKETFQMVPQKIKDTEINLRRLAALVMKVAAEIPEIERKDIIKTIEKADELGLLK
jgi:hypothetical protein